MGTLAFPKDSPASTPSQNLRFTLVTRGEFPLRLHRRIEAISDQHCHPDASLTRRAMTCTPAQTFHIWTIRQKLPVTALCKACGDDMPRWG
jgi:hypothetical protein